MIAYRQNREPAWLAYALPLAEIAAVAYVLSRAEQAVRAPTIASIQAAVCSRFRLKPNDMHTQRRDRVICRPRQIAMYLCRELTPRSFPQIGRAFGNRDHTTVIHACRTIERLTASDPAFGAEVSGLERELGEGSRG